MKRLISGCLLAIIALYSGGLTPAERVLLSSGIPSWVPNKVNPPDLAVNWTTNQAWTRSGGVTTPAALGVSTSRASVKQVVDSGGNWSQVASNVTAMSNLGRSTEEARTNSIRNNTMQGAVAGSPGTLPTNWSASFVAGLSTNVIAVGTSLGIDYVDIQVTGTPGSVGSNILSAEGTNAIAALYGQTWSQSFFVALVGGNFTNVASLKLEVRERNSGGSFLASNNGSQLVGALTSSLVRQTASTTLSNAATAFVQPNLLFNSTDTVTPINFTLRIGWPQLENNSINSTVASATVAAGGASGVSGTAVYSVGGGTGTAATLNVTVSGGAITAINSVASAGSYSVFPTSPAALTYVSGTGSGVVGATVNLTPTNLAANAFATSPIKTTAGAATRAADFTSLLGLSYGSAFSLFEKFTAQSPVLYSNNQYILEISDGEDVNQRLLMFRALGSAPLAPRYSVGGSNVYTGASVGTILQNVSSKAAIAAISGTQNSALNGTALTSGTGVGTITPNVVNFGCDPTGGHQLNGLAAIDAIWLNKAVPSSQLQSMTQ